MKSEVLGRPWQPFGYDSELLILAANDEYGGSILN